MGKEVIQGLDGKHYMSRLCVCVGGGEVLHESMHLLKLRTG